MKSIRMFITRESYKKIASFYKEVKKHGKVQKLSWFLDQESGFWWSQEEATDFVIREILLNFSYYKEKKIIDHYNDLHPRGKMKKHII